MAAGDKKVFNLESQIKSQEFRGGEDGWESQSTDSVNRYLQGIYYMEHLQARGYWVTAMEKQGPSPIHSKSALHNTVATSPTWLRTLEKNLKFGTSATLAPFSVLHSHSVASGRFIGQHRHRAFHHHRELLWAVLFQMRRKKMED